MVTAIKKSVDGDGIIVRCYETEDVDTEAEIRVFDTTFNATFKHSQVKTFAINNGEVKEVNLVEW